MSFAHQAIVMSGGLPVVTYPTDARARRGASNKNEASIVPSEQGLEGEWLHAGSRSAGYSGFHPHDSVGLGGGPYGAGRAIAAYQSHSRPVTAQRPLVDTYA